MAFKARVFYSPVKSIRGGVEKTQARYSDAIKFLGFRAIPRVRVLDALASDFVWVVYGTERKVVLHVTCFSPFEKVLLSPSVSLIVRDTTFLTSIH